MMMSQVYKEPMVCNDHSFAVGVTHCHIKVVDDTDNKTRLKMP